MKQLLDELVEKLKAAAGKNLKAVVLYGSAASGNFHARHSDLNVLCLVDHSGATDLEALSPVAQWWIRKGHPAPLVFTAEELRRSAELFAIEMRDIRDHHQMLHGEDFLAAFDVPMMYHHWQVKRDLRSNWLRLRQAIVSAPKKRSAQLGIMTASISTFAALFRHALIALGEPAPENNRAAFDRFGVIVSANPAPFHTILDVREGKQQANKIEADSTLRGYLDFVHRVTNEVDRRVQLGDQT